MNKQQHRDSGMRIPCSVRETPDKGRGVFAEAAVSSGTTIWCHVPGQFQVLDQAAFEALLAGGSVEEAAYELTHVVPMAEFPGHVVRYFDEGALINHCDRPNVIRKFSAADYQPVSYSSSVDIEKLLIDDHFDLVASRDLSVGDELLMDYNAEPDDPEWLEDAYKRFRIDWDWL